MASPEMLTNVTAEGRLSKHLEPLSPLMRAKANNPKGEKVNACPFGCTVEEIDDQGYCRHLVGFTVPGNDKLYEPLIVKRGRRRVEVRREKIMLGDNPSGNGEDDWTWGPPVYENVQDKDQLVKITTSSRVYRDVKADIRALAKK